MSGPQRTCHACRRKAPQAELLRFVCGPKRQAILDLRRKLPGRGAYLCPRLACLRKGVRSKGIAGPLDCQPPDTSAEDLCEKAKKGLARMLGEAIGHARRAGAVVHGADRVIGALEQGKADVLLVAADVAERTRTNVSKQVGADRLVTALTKTELGDLLGESEVGVAAIGHPQLAERIRLLALCWNRLREESVDGPS